MVNIGQLIKQRRKELGLNGVEMAHRLGVHHSTIYCYENGNIEKMPSTLLGKIADVLDADLAYFMGVQKEPRIKKALKKLTDPQTLMAGLTSENKEKVIAYINSLLAEQ